MSQLLMFGSVGCTLESTLEQLKVTKLALLSIQGLLKICDK